MMSNWSVHIKYPTCRDYIPPLACSVTGDFCSFDLASRGTALTLRLRDSFRPLTCGLSRKSRRFLHNARIGTSVPLTGIAAAVCFCLPAGVSHPAHLPAGFHSHRRTVLFRPPSCYNDKNVYYLWELWIGAVLKEYTIADYLNKNAEAGNISFHIISFYGN